MSLKHGPGREAPKMFRCPHCGGRGYFFESCGKDVDNACDVCNGQGEVARAVGCSCHGDAFEEVRDDGS